MLRVRLYNDIKLLIAMIGCGYCKKMKPEYEALGHSAVSTDFTLVKVDATVPMNKELAATYGVRGYPTVMYFPHGISSTPEMYNGERTTMAMEQFLMSKK